MKFQSILDDLQKRSVALLGATGEYASAYRRLDAVVYQAGALSARHKELIALLIGVALQCEDCIAYHVRRCQRAGVSREELAEGLVVAAQMAGGPGLAFASKALAAFDEFAGETSR
jgi:AhpD family alkylhydroperoxidase